MLGTYRLQHDFFRKIELVTLTSRIFTIINVLKDNKQQILLYNLYYSAKIAQIFLIAEKRVNENSSIIAKPYY